MYKCNKVLLPERFQSAYTMTTWERILETLQLVGHMKFDNNPVKGLKV